MGDVEMKADENENENERDDLQKNEDAMGVQGGMGDTAPICDDDNDDDIEMEEEQKENDDDDEVQQQMSDIYGDDQQQMMTKDENMGEWKPMNQQKQNEEEKKKKNEQNKQQQQTRDDKSNPFESLSDALTEWKQRLDVIESDETAQKEQEVGDEDADKENDDNIDSEQYAMVPDDVKVDNEEQA